MPEGVLDLFADPPAARRRYTVTKTVRRHLSVLRRYIALNERLRTPLVKCLHGWR